MPSVLATGLLTQRVTCYSLTEAGTGPFTAPRYVTAGTTWGRLVRGSGRQPYSAVVAGQVIDGTLYVRSSAPVTQDGVVAVGGVYYRVLATILLDTQDRWQCPVQHIERAKFATDDQPMATLVLAPAAVTVPHGTPSALAVTTIAGTDAFGYPTPGVIYIVKRTAGTSTVTAVVRGTVLDLFTIPNAPATGDQFTISAQGLNAVLSVTVS